MIQHITEIVNETLGGDNTHIFNTTDVWVIDKYTSSAFNGTPSNMVYFYSDTSDKQATICLSAIGNISSSYIYFEDINIINGKIFTDDTCIEGGNNTGVIFQGKCYNCSFCISDLSGTKYCTKYQEYVGYDCYNPICQQCTKNPQFPDDPYVCYKYLDKYCGINTNSCEKCLKSSASTSAATCDMEYMGCRGYNKNACRDCYRQISGSTSACRDCRDVVSWNCTGLDSKRCKMCTRVLNCRGCTTAWKYPKISYLENKNLYGVVNNSCPNYVRENVKVRDISSIKKRSPLVTKASTGKIKTSPVPKNN